MRSYECMVLVRSSVEAEKMFEKLIKPLKDSDDCNIRNTIDLGIRELAYSIKKLDFGRYYLLYFDVEDNKTLRAFDKSLSLNEDVLRFIILQTSDEPPEDLLDMLHFETVKKDDNKTSIPEVPAEVLAHES